MILAVLGLACPRLGPDGANVARKDTCLLGVADAGTALGLQGAGPPVATPRTRLFPLARRDVRVAVEGGLEEAGRTPQSPAVGERVGADATGLPATGVVHGTQLGALAS